MFINTFAEAAEAAVNRRDVDAVLALWREPAAYTSALTGPQSGLQALADRETALFAAFEDLTATVTPVGQTGLTGAITVRFTGTHTGAYGPFPASHNSFDVDMAAVITFDEDGYVVAEQVYLDSATLAAQLSTPAP